MIEHRVATPEKHFVRNTGVTLSVNIIFHFSVSCHSSWFSLLLVHQKFVVL